jgi:hypothetical protein
MVAVEELPTVSEVLDALREVLDEENQSLRTLDRDGIEDAARKKLGLHDLLLELTEQTPPDTGELEMLADIKRAALANQLLLVHARACVQGVLSLAIGEPLGAAVARDGTVQTSGPLRLDLRG